MFNWFKKSNRKKIKDVKPGEFVVIEWWRCATSVCSLECINNDTKTKKILLQVKWNNYKEQNLPEFEKVVFDYNAVEFENFHLLNAVNIKTISDTQDDFDLPTLQKQMNEFLEKEEYERAEVLQKKINKLLNK